MERRATDRHSVSKQVFISAGEGAKTCRRSAALLNLSATGCCLESDLLVTPGSELLVDLNEFLLVGEVRYCEPSKDGRFRIGLSILRRWVQDIKELDGSL